jgi:hypothetical protein
MRKCTKKRLHLQSLSAQLNSEELSWSGAERRARRERPGAHAEARAERRRNVAEEVAATGAVAVVRSGSRDIGAHPLAAGFAERIDTLHGKTGHVLHFFSLTGRKAQVNSCATTKRSRIKIAKPPGGQSPRSAPTERRPWLRHWFGTRGNSASVGADSAARELWCQEKRLQGIVVRLQGHGRPNLRVARCGGGPGKKETQRFEETMQTELEITKDRFT